VRFERVSVRYPNAEASAVEDVSLELSAGAFTVILGPSGCGKSTLLRTVNRMVVPAAGRVYVDGTDNAQININTLRRSTGYVIQAVGLFAHMSVADNIAIVPGLLQWDSKRIEQRVDELLDLVRLPATYRNRLPRELSGGEQQRVGVARAIAARPRVLLMDEPFGAVDAIVRKSLQEESKRIAQLLKTTILFVTHDVDEALGLADRIVVMAAGKVVQYGTPLELLTNPTTPFVEDLLDTHDVVRRLGLLRAQDVMQPPRPETEGAIDAQATLRDSLNQFLQGAGTLAVERDGRRIGTLDFGDVQAAIRR